MTSTTARTVATPARPRTLALAAILCVLAGACVAGILAGGRSGQVPAPAATRLAPSSQGSLLRALGASDRSFWATSSAAGLHFVSPGHRLSASFAASRVSLAAAGLHVTLGLPELSSAAAPRASANRVTYAGSDVSTWFVNGPAGIEQGFRVARAPAAGQLTLAMPIAGNAAARLSDGGAAVTFTRRGSTALSYSHLLATDARGRVLHASLAVSGGMLRIVVDAVHAAFPVTVDPTVAEISHTGAELPSSGDLGGAFGYSVSVSDDGRTAIVGAPHVGTLQGGAWIFTRTGSTWSAGTLLADTQETGPSADCGGPEQEDKEECSYGHSVAISGDGHTALVGSPRAHDNDGSVLVFTLSGTTWTETAVLKGRTETAPGEVEGEEGAQGRFGKSVALSDNGTVALIGASTDSSDSGAAFVYKLVGGAWTQVGSKLTATGAEHETGKDEGHFGYAVAISADGNTGVVSAPTEGNGTPTGAGYGSAWVIGDLQDPLKTEDRITGGGEETGEGDFGYSVAISADSSTILVGGAKDHAWDGAAWFFKDTEAGWRQQGPKIVDAEAAPEGAFGYSVALSAHGELALIGAPQESGFAGVAWIYAQSGSTWAPQGAELRPDEENGSKGWFGAAVALSSDATTALVGGFRYAGGTGQVWSFTQPEACTENCGKEPCTENCGGGSGNGSGGNNTGGNNTTGNNQNPSVGSTGVQSFKTQQLPAPTLGVTGNLLALGGVIRVKLPGSNVFVYVTLRQVPFGSVIDASHGRVQLTTVGPHGKLQTIDFYGGYFSITQSRKSGVVIARLWGGNFSVCPKVTRNSAFAAAKSKKHVVRKLWAEGHGSYTTKGSYATGAVLGTRWLTEDRCDGTLIYVATDKVLVTNTRTHRHFTIRAGHSYLALR